MRDSYGTVRPEEARHPHANALPPQRRRPPKPPSGPRPLHAGKAADPGVMPDEGFAEENWDESPQKGPRGGGQEAKENSDNDSQPKRASYIPEFAGGVKPDANFADDDWDDD